MLQVDVHQVVLQVNVRGFSLWCMSTFSLLKIVKVGDGQE